MLKHRVMPVILLDNNYLVVKTIKFKSRRGLGNPITAVRVYNSRDVDELILLDIDATRENRSIDYSIISDISSECFMPLSIGGGIKGCIDIERTLHAGADRVVINSQAIVDDKFIKDAVKMFGSQSIIVSIDAKYDDFGNFEIYSSSGYKAPTLLEHVGKMIDSGAGELMINCVDADGTMAGFNNNLIKLVSSNSSIPIIACGGASTTLDFVNVIKEGADAVAASSIFHFTKITPTECKMEMKKHGIPVRGG
jgi:cyclase